MSKEQPTSPNRERFAKAEEDAKILNERFAKTNDLKEVMEIGRQERMVKIAQEQFKRQDELEAYDIEDMRKQLSEAAVLGDADKIIELGQQMKTLQGQENKPDADGVDVENIRASDEAQITEARAKIDGIDNETVQESSEKGKIKESEQSAEDASQKKLIDEYLNHLENYRVLSAKSREVSDRFYSLEKSNDSNHPVVVAAKKELDEVGVAFLSVANSLTAIFKKLSVKTRSEYLDREGEDKNDQEVQIQKYLAHLKRYETLSEKNRNARISFDSKLGIYSDRDHPLVVEAKNAWNAAGIELDNERQIGSNIFKNLTEETKDRRLNKNGTAKE